MRDRLKSAQTRAHSVAVLLLFKVLYTCFLVGCWHVSYPTEIASAFLGLRLPWWQHFLPDRTWLDRGPRGPVLGQPWCRSTWGETVTVFVSHRGLVTVHGAEEQREAACGGQSLWWLCYRLIGAMGSSPSTCSSFIWRSVMLYKPKNRTLRSKLHWTSDTNTWYFMIKLITSQLQDWIHDSLYYKNLSVYMAFPGGPYWLATTDIFSLKVNF